MKLFNNLHNIILEQTTPWYVKVFESEDFESLWPITKMFGGDLHEIYKALEKMDKGEDFIRHISHTWPWDEQPMTHVIDALGGMNRWRRGMLDNDLLDIYVHQPYIEDISNLSYDKDRIILELLGGEEHKLFGGSNYNGDDCRYVAEQIFSEEGLDWEPYDTDMKLEDLIEMLSPENYIKLVRHIGIEFQNQEVDAWREEFDQVREDNGKVIITPRFMNGFLPDNESTRYNLAVLIGNTPELGDIEIEIKHAYSRAYNDVIINQYYEDYNDALEELLGPPIKQGYAPVYNWVKNPETGQREEKKREVPFKSFDVTDLARTVITRHAHDIDSPEDFLNLLDEYDYNNICPSVDNYPYDEEEVKNNFQELLWEYL
tara:strand:- start:69 stop:1187 length:1119 start_codon:yes stop_codon:yes gene_type:complete